MIELLSGAYSVLLVRGGKCLGALRQIHSAAGRRPVPLPSMVERCSRIEEQLEEMLAEIRKKSLLLRELQDNLTKGSIELSQTKRFVSGLLMSYRDQRRSLESIEEHFVGHILRFTETDQFFTRLASVLWSETGLPGTPPIAITNTSGYFCTLASLGIIFSPPSIEHNLLIFPDLYHEFGHILQKSGSINLVGPRFDSALEAHINDLHNQVRRISRPLDPALIDEIEQIWRRTWSEEVACDTLATFVLGPAYAWCNLHLCLQNGNAYSDGYEHPADAARTGNLIRILRRRGFCEAATQVENEWNGYMDFSASIRTPYYSDFHPDSLFIAVMEDVEQALIDAGIRTDLKGPTVELLNRGWQEFNQNRATYHTWEANALSELRLDCS